MTPERVAEFLARIPTLPGSAVVPVSVAAAHDGVSKRTVYRNYQLVPISPRRKGVRVDYLRSSRKHKAA